MTAKIAIINGTSRTARYLVPQALAAGKEVVSIVRSASRAKYDLSAVERSHLTITEVPDFNNTQQIADAIRDGVDTVFITIAPSINEPTTFFSNTVHSVVAAIRTVSEARDSKAETPRLVLLSASNASKYVNTHKFTLVERFFKTQLFNHIYDDLNRVQAYLSKQSTWLEWASVHPGIIVDSSAQGEQQPEGPARIPRYRLSTNEMATGEPIAYSSLASAMLEVASDAEWPKYRHDNVSPISMEPVSVTAAELGTMREFIAYWARHRVLAPGIKYLAVAAVGYFVAVERPWRVGVTFRGWRFGGFGSR